jgi:hypothetical protein
MNVDTLIEKLCRLRDKYGEGMNVRLNLEIRNPYGLTLLMIGHDNITVISDDENGEALLHWDESMEG